MFLVALIGVGIGIAIGIDTTRSEANTGNINLFTMKDMKGTKPANCGTGNRCSVLFTVVHRSHYYRKDTKRANETDGGGNLPRSANNS